MGKLSFAGHESFTCKQFWLKKGADFVTNNDNSFNSNQAVVTLGVGKNMVRAIRFWLRSFGVTDENDNLTKVGSFLLGENGLDPYLESLGSIWLLHYHLVKENKASIYNLVFNEFRRKRPEFQIHHLQNFIKRYINDLEKKSYNENTVKRDIHVFLNNYLPPSLNKRSDIEDSFSGLLYELKLIKEIKKEDPIRKTESTYYSIEADHRDNLPWQVVLYAILDNKDYSTSITFHDLYSSKSSPGSVFALSHEGLYNKIQEICEAREDCSYSETAGNRVFQIGKALKTSDPLDLLKANYD